MKNSQDFIIKEMPYSLSRRDFFCLLPEGEFGMLETETPVGEEEVEPEIAIYKELCFSDTYFDCENSQQEISLIPLQVLIGGVWTLQALGSAKAWV